MQTLNGAGLLAIPHIILCCLLCFAECLIASQFYKNIILTGRYSICILPYIYIYIYIYMEVLRKMDLKSIKVFIIIEDMGIIGILHAKESFGYQMVLWQLTA